MSLVYTGLFYFKIARLSILLFVSSINPSINACYCMIVFIVVRALVQSVVQSV